MPAFSSLHVVINLLAIGTGFIVMLGFAAARSRQQWTRGCLGMTVAANLTAFGSPLGNSPFAQ